MTATIGRPTQTKIQSSTAGSGEMSPITKPTAIAPYHHASPSARSTVRAAPARPAGTGRVRYEGPVLAVRAVRAVTTKEAATAAPAPAR